MDNPWASGWSDETVKPAFNDTKPDITSPSWTAHSTGGETETDLASPSWTTGADVKWAEPSDTQGSLWSQTVDSPHLDAWGSSTYKGIHLGGLPLQPPSPQAEEDNEDQPSSSPVQREVITPIPSPVQEVTITPPRAPSPTSESPHLPPSSSVFGSFETAVNAGTTTDDDPWSSSTSAFPPDTEEVNHWGSAWTAPKIDEDEITENKLPDEWEVARQRKENMDRHVPPELLASILQKCEENSPDLWPDPEAAKDMEKDDYRNNQFSGMEGVEGLTALINRVAPEGMTLPPIIPFGKSFTAKSMAESIRLSRHVPLARRSPMSQLMASKGSTAWETSVKSRPEVVQDDLPVGWRVVEEGPAQAADAGKGRKIGGGLLSFWGRRAAANTAVDIKREGSMSPVQAPSASPRSSIDTAKPPLIATPAGKPISPTTASAPISTPPPIIPLSTASTAISSPSASPQTIQPDLFDPVEVQPGPSAVSRFLGRFSRTKPTTLNQRHSLALSSDDLEFLSDFVPGESDDDGDPQLNALSSMIESSPLPTKLPPPLAPPPKPPSISRPVSSGGVPKPQTNASNDIDALFSLSAEPTAALAASSPHPSLPPAMSPTFSVTSTSSVTSSPLTSFTPLPSKFPPVDNPLSAFILPPPSSSSSRSQSPTPTPPAFTKPISPPPLPPPPSGPSQTRAPKYAPPTTSLLSNSFDDEDDDEFSAFHSPPSAYRQSGTSQYDSSFSPPSSKRLLQQPPNPLKSMSSSFDDFDDFISSPLRSPTPPVPPAKSPPRQNIINPPMVIPTHQKKVSSADHIHAENVFEIDFFGDTSSTKPEQTNTATPSMSTPAWMNLAPPTSSNGMDGVALLPPPSSQPNLGTSSMSFPSNSVQSSAPSFGAFNATPSPALQSSASKPKSTGGNGGLSAQDLSFFEGL